MADQVRVTGLKELRLELKALDPQWPKQLQKVNKAIAEQVAEGTRADFQALGGSGPKAASTVKALAQQARAQVKFGGKGDSVPERVAGGNAFGSNQYPQFPKPGVYALYPALARMKDDIEVRYIEMLDDLLSRAFPD
jgi:hypothetical protein